MTPAARLQAAIEILDGIEAALASNGAPADLVVKRYFKTRRYVGAKDRAAVSGLVYDALRSRGSLVWALGQTGSAVTGRHMMLALGADRALFGAGGYGPAPLTADEEILLDRLAAIAATMPDAAKANVPDHLYSQFLNRFGDNIQTELEALAGRAPLDLRVNGMRLSRAEAQTALAARGIVAQPAPYSPWGLRIAGPAALADDPLYRDGSIEIQDEAAQVAVLLAGAAPRMTVVDLCAGAGGKSLALYAAMAGEGRLLAADVVQGKLTELERRAKRAGIAHLPTHALPLDGAARAAALAALAGDGADILFLDVPCTGSGTWRRSPDLRWRHDAGALAGLTARQAVLIDEAVGLTRPGGRIVYATCSLLPAEDEDQIAAALARHAGLSLIPYRQAWPLAPESCPQTAARNQDCLLMTPARHGTDGFFVAILQKSAI